MDGEGPHADYLFGADQKIPLVKITFLGRVETATKSSIKSRLGITGAQVAPFWACGFLVNTSKDCLPHHH